MSPKRKVQEKSLPISFPFVVQMVVFVLLVPLLPLVISGNWTWWEAWVYAGVYVLGFIISRALVARRHPGLLAERARFADHEDGAVWDQVLAPLVALGGGTLPLTAGLDARYDWSAGFHVFLKLLSLLCLLIGYGLGSWAMLENRFFSGMVRIQEERGHRVVSSGPYRWIRHPGYLGAVLAYLGTPAFLDSWWAYLPAGTLVALLVWRTKLEDEMLRKELEGYQGYARTVRHRLLPGVW